jgi:hypothetical protein
VVEEEEEEEEDAGSRTVVPSSRFRPLEFVAVVAAIWGDVLGAYRCDSRERFGGRGVEVAWKKSFLSMRGST